MNNIDVEWSIMQSRSLRHQEKPSKLNYPRLFWYTTAFPFLPLPRVTRKKKTPAIHKALRDQTVHREDLLPVTSHQHKLTSHLRWRIRQFLGVVRFTNWVLRRNVFVWALKWGKLKLDERNERCRYTELTWVKEGGGGHTAVFIIPENCRYIPPNESTSIFFQYYLADVQQCFKSVVATTVTLPGNFDYSLTRVIPTITPRFTDLSKIRAKNMLRGGTWLLVSLLYRF
jgi:hypothetical protein